MDHINHILSYIVLKLQADIIKKFRFFYDMVYKKLIGSW